MADMESKLDILKALYYDENMESELLHRRGWREERLEALRKARGIRQEELAEAIGVSRQTIGSLENGRYNPSIRLAFKIARYFGLSIEEIFIDEEEQK